VALQVGCRTSALRLQAQGKRIPVPGSPETDVRKPSRTTTRAIHPAALLLACSAAGLGIALTSSLFALAASAVITFALALRTERRPIQAEVPLLVLALIVFAAHTLLSAAPVPQAVGPAGAIALRLLALLYLLRYAARSFLGGAARWALSLPLPGRPRWLLQALESGRHALTLTPRAIREAEQQHMALRARGLHSGQGLGGRARYLAAWVLPFLGTMLRLGESYEEALLVRGYALGAPRRSGQVLAWGLPEVTVLILGALTAAALLRGV
jgi:energy-coupling factor transporter transmembrane protein EcfT